jgi:predicted nucleic acid-binding Zn ribbon protein
MDHNTNNIGDLIKVFLKKRGLNEKMVELDISENWEKLAGKMVAQHTESVKLSNKTLTLRLNSAALRHTLSFSKTEFIQKLNQGLGKEMVTEIVLK